MQKTLVLRLQDNRKALDKYNDYCYNVATMNNTNEQPKPTVEAPAIIDKVPGMPVEVVPVVEQGSRELIDRVPGAPTEVAPVDESVQPQRMQEYGGYTNIRSHQPGTRYEPGMPIRIDTPVNPQTGDPQVPKLD